MYRNITALNQKNQQIFLMADKIMNILVLLQILRASHEGIVSVMNKLEDLNLDSSTQPKIPKCQLMSIYTGSSVANQSRSISVLQIPLQTLYLKYKVEGTGKME